VEELDAEVALVELDVAVVALVDEVTELEVEVVAEEVALDELVDELEELDAAVVALVDALEELGEAVGTASTFEDWPCAEVNGQVFAKAPLGVDEKAETSTVTDCRSEISASEREAGY